MRVRPLGAFNRTGRGHQAGGMTPIGNTPAPRSKPVAHASRLVTHYASSVAFGRGVKIPAAEPARSQLYSPFERLRARRRKVWRDFSRGEYGVKRGRRGYSCAGQATCPSSRLRRCGHRTRRDPRGGRRLYVGDRLDREPRRAAGAHSCFWSNTRFARIAGQRQGRRATPTAAPLRAARWNSELAGSPCARRPALLRAELFAERLAEDREAPLLG